MPHDDDPRQNFPRDKDTLLRDFTLAGRLKDIRDAVNLKHTLAPKWWETGLGVLQFGAALGLLASLVYFNHMHGDQYGGLVIFWLALMILTLVFSFEFLIFKIHHLRRANDIALRLLNDLLYRVEELEKRAGEKREQP